MNPPRILSLLALVLGGCVAATGAEPADELGERQSSLTSSQRRERAAAIRDAAAGEGLVNGGWLLAGIADAETQMSHCWYELTWACQGPPSADCGGGPTVAGAGDGPCYLQEGGIGMFQFDAGRFDDTLRREGDRILSIAGNTQAAVDFVVDMVIRSVYIAGVSTRAQAIDWMNGVRVDNARFDPWVRTVTHYYNGCRPSFSCFGQRYGHYRDNARGVWFEMGGDGFWTGATPAAPTVAMEVYWARQADGAYHFRALAPEAIARVTYEVDGWPIGSARRADGHNFPIDYAFSSATDERELMVRGFDADGDEVGQGVGLMDVTDGVAVYVKQMGASLYEIGLERAPTGVAAIEVRADGYLLTDSVTGAARSGRNAVRSRFNTLGVRGFEISTYSPDGTWRGTLRRSFELR